MGGANDYSLASSVRSVGTICKKSSSTNRIWIDLSIYKDGTYFVFFSVPQNVDEFYFSNNDNNNMFLNASLTRNEINNVYDNGINQFLLACVWNIKHENNVYKIYLNDSLFMETERNIYVSTRSNSVSTGTLLLGVFYLV